MAPPDVAAATPHQSTKSSIGDENDANGFECHKTAEFDVFDDVSLNGGAESVIYYDGLGGAINRAPNSVSFDAANGAATNGGRKGPSSAEDGVGLHDESCGCLGFHPEFARRFRTPAWMLFCFCLASFIQGMVVNGLVNVIISTVERRFQLSSTESGLIASFYDIGYFFCAIPVTYFGGRSQASKPKWVSAGVLFMAAGFFIFCLPHFTTPEYVAVKNRDAHHHQQTIVDGAGNITSNASAHLCSETKNAVDCSPPEESLAYYKWVFYLAQFLIGCGATPLYTLAVTYVDENVVAKSSSLYLGFFYAMASVGPAVGYVLGGQTLQIFTDFSTVDAKGLGLTPENNLWVGAWWLGFLGAAIFGILIFAPIAALPKMLPGGKEVRATRKRETHQSNVQLTKWLETTKASNTEKAKGSSLTGIHVRELSMALVRLVVGNPTFLFLSLAGAAEGFLLAGFATFLPKYFENQFRLTAGFAAMLVGLVAVPGAGGGTLLGGYIIKKYDMKLPAILRMCCISTFLAGISSIVFVFSCDDVEIAGVTAPYSSSSFAFNATQNPDVLKRTLNLLDECNSNCNCDLSEYDPMCGSDGLLYYSPCFAGCTEFSRQHDQDVMEFSRCSCIMSSINSSIVLGSGLGKNCPSECTYLPVAVIFLLLIMVMTFITSMPSLTATLRCVEEADRSVALGVQLAFLRILGTIPAPVLFGKLMDLACSLWETIPGPDASCSNSDPSQAAGDGTTELGSCRAYYNHHMSAYLLTVAVIGKAFEFFFFFMSWKMYRAPPEAEGSSPNKVNVQSRPALQNGTPSDGSSPGANQQVQMTNLSSTVQQPTQTPTLHGYDNPIPIDCN